MNDAYIDALSAMFDGENIDPATLREALTDRGAADWLLDFAAWRAEFRQGSSRPSDEFYKSMVPILRFSRWRRFLAVRRLNLPVAAAFALSTAVLGFAIRPAVERATPPVPAFQAGGPNRGATPVQTTSQPTVDAHPSKPTLTKSAPTVTVPPTGRRLGFTGWRESRVSE